MLPDVVAYLEKQKPWVSCGHNTGFVAGLIGMVPLEFQMMVTALCTRSLTLNIPSESASDDNLAEWTGVS